jgi:hypothetical protein
MKTFNIRCVTLDDFCDTHELDIFAVDDILLESDYSYGTNDDTLVGYHTLCSMCGVDPLPGYYDDNNRLDLMVSLGS